MGDNIYRCTVKENMPLKVLVIDRDTSLTDLLTQLLKPRGFEIIAASTTALGIESIQQLEPRVVILDWNMPGVNGLKVCRKVRRFSQVPIVVISAFDDPELVAKALDAGADDYLVKPVPSGVLIAHLNKLTRRVDMTGNDSTIHTDPPPNKNGENK